MRHLMSPLDLSAVEELAKVLDLLTILKKSREICP